MSVPRSLLLGAVSLLLSLSMLGCATTAAETALRERASKERACTADKLTVTSLGASAYRVEGCGPPETFICIAYQQGWVCTKEGGPQSAQRVARLVATFAALQTAATAAQQDRAEKSQSAAHGATSAASVLMSQPRAQDPPDVVPNPATPPTPTR